jgi:hypothetical protein
MYEARLAAIVMAVRYREFDVTDHADRQMQRPDRSLTRSMVVAAMTGGDIEIIEDYPGDVRGPSCLCLCWLAGRALHVQVSYPPRPTIITVYWPDSEPSRWSTDFRRRIR